MRYLLTTMIFLMLFSNCYSQVGNDETLKIIGKAKKMITPDLVDFTFRFDAKDKNQSIAQSKLVNETNKLVDKLMELGCNKKDIKYLSFNVEEDIDYNDGKSKRIGYSATNEIEFVMIYEPMKLAMFIDTIAKTGIKYLDYSFKLEVSDSLKNSTRDTLIKNAIKNALNSAKTISQYSSVDLVGINNIEYSDLVFNFASHGDLLPPPPPMMMMKLEAPQIASSRLRYDSVSLKETEVYEEVVITWRIKNIR